MHRSHPQGDDSLSTPPSYPPPRRPVLRAYSSVLQSRSCPGHDSFPLAGSHDQLLPHNTEEKPKPEKIQKILALVLTSTLVGRFSLLSDCEVYLKARNFCLLSPPECKFHVVPPVHWHPYIESSCFPVLGWFFWVFNIRGSISFVCMNPNPALTSAMFAWWLALFASLASLSPLP